MLAQMLLDNYGVIFMLGMSRMINANVPLNIHSDVSANVCLDVDVNVTDVHSNIHENICTQNGHILSDVPNVYIEFQLLYFLQFLD